MSNQWPTVVFARLCHSLHGLRQYWEVFYSRLSRVLRGRASEATQSITGLLILLMVLFVVGMALLSHLNLSYSQQAMHKLRLEQIQDVVKSGLSRMNTHQAALARRTQGLANMGESFYRLSLSASRSQRATLREQLTLTLRDYLKDMPGVSGGGIWFNPNILAAKGQTYAVQLNKTAAGFEPIELPRDVDYRAQRWFELTFGKDGRPGEEAEFNTAWSPVYFDFVTEQAILTLARPMLNEAGQIIGWVTTNWSSEQLVELVSHVEVTANSFAFLNDRNNRNLSSLSEIADPKVEQHIIDAILAKRLTADTWTPASRQEGALQSALQTMSLDVDGRTYELYYAGTPAGMVYGAGVPQQEIDSVLVPMRDTNYRILLGTAAVMLILGGYLVYRLLLLIRELKASYTDVLTGLYNRTRLLKDAEAQPDAALMILNLDRFKEINSLFGHECGDEVLKEVARRLQGFVKQRIGELCTAHQWPVLKGRPFHVYRLGADEFALLGPAMDEPVAEMVAGAMIESVRQQAVIWQHQSISLETSVGITFQTAQSMVMASDVLLSQATIAVVQARQQIRPYVFYDQLQEIEKSYERNLYWARRLKEGLEQDQMLPHFQPIYDNRLKRITKYECLVRMQDAEQGVIAAGQFIGVAGRLRLNRQITRVMIEKSFAAFEQAPYEFSINLSYADVVDPEILDLIMTQLSQLDIGSRVIFEILESDGIDNYEDVLHFIEKVKPYGCKIAIDDFGTGYSNFAHLLKLNVDIIKIDGSLIRHLDEDPTAVQVARGIVQFAHSLGIKTVAEFVHNEAVQTQVAALGIDFSQGGFFSMPRPDLMQLESHDV
ncbi:bifunctional diguanylate cyclase/phosphodiesterase [Terasakiispira papahanaumokuakeensis]|uniref:bifunctional diguanylate cyclase/phosphodiesterase n=1 Tax=Terasakiispira papahanaumokuakeensis TaxID=197479 RepID=UPI000A04ABC7|nr:EAL domain-containing protein [Terasakiispira papahanaumokuakeensis]